MTFGLLSLILFIYGINLLIDAWTGNTPRAVERKIETELSVHRACLREIAEKMKPHLCFIKIENNVFYAQVSPDFTRVEKIIEKIGNDSDMDTDNLYVYDWEDVG